MAVAFLLLFLYAGFPPDCAGQILPFHSLQKYYLFGPGESLHMGEISPEAPNILQRNFHAAAPNQKWLTNLTEFALPVGKVYLSPVIDCFDGMVHSGTIGTSPNTQLVNNMLETALATLRPGEHPIIHSDRGCHYRWLDWIKLAHVLDSPDLCQGKGVH